jgi:hypothetical protein
MARKVEIWVVNNALDEIRGAAFGCASCGIPMEQALTLVKDGYDEYRASERAQSPAKAKETENNG